jgi:hypothetical protein
MDRLVNRRRDLTSQGTIPRIENEYGGLQINIIGD